MTVILDEVSCSTAEEFLMALSPIGEYFKNSEPDVPWLFRGQGKDYPLIPSLFRKDEAAKKNLQSFTKQNINDYLGLRYAERDILIDFFSISDKRGLILPSDSQELRSSLENWKSEDDDFLTNPRSHWIIRDEVLSLLALAQHFGIPTRLLDWTRQSFVAAFFAAESARKDSVNLNNKKNKNPDLLVVWAFYFPVLGKYNIVDRQDDPLRVVTAPSATNSNLKAQRGVFIELNHRYTKEAEGDYPPLNKFLVDYELSANKLISTCRLRKITLPANQADHLLYLLAKLDITPSAIYPGYHSIVSDLQMQRNWGSS